MEWNGAWGKVLDTKESERSVFCPLRQLEFEAG